MGGVVSRVRGGRQRQGRSLKWRVARRVRAMTVTRSGGQRGPGGGSRRGPLEGSWTAVTRNARGLAVCDDGLERGLWQRFRRLANGNGLWKRVSGNVLGGTLGRGRTSKCDNSYTLFDFRRHFRRLPKSTARRPFPKALPEPPSAGPSAGPFSAASAGPF